MRAVAPILDDRLDTLHVLVIDESCATAEMVQSRLADASVQVHHCVRPSDAIEMAVDRAPDHIFIDHSLVSANAGALRRKLRADARTRHIPVSFLLGASAAWETNLHAHEYVTVPFEAEQIEHALGIA